MNFANFNFFVRVYFYKKYGNYSIIDYKTQILFTKDLQDVRLFDTYYVQSLDSFNVYIEEKFPLKRVTSLDQKFFSSLASMKSLKELGIEESALNELYYYDFDGFYYLEDEIDSVECHELLVGYFYKDEVSEVDFNSTKSSINFKEVISFLFFFMFF